MRGIGQGLGSALLLFGVGVVGGCTGSGKADDFEPGRNVSDDSGEGEASAGISQDDYVDAYASALCEWATGCGLLGVFGGTPAACLDVVRAELEGSLGEAGCHYDPVAAQQCLDGLARSTCDAPFEDPACEEICSADGA